MWVSELLWVAEAELHHVESGSGLGDLADVEEESGEDEGELEWHIVNELKLNLTKMNNAYAEEHLNGKNENSFLENVELI